MVDGDQVMAICGLYMKIREHLKEYNYGYGYEQSRIFQMGERENINIEQTKVGDRYVLERMLKEGYNLGGEQSGHIIFLDENTTGDGLISALHLLEVMVNTGKKLSELASVMTVLPQALVNAKVANRKKEYYLDNKIIADAIKAFENKFSGEGRVLIRPSGTEPLIRVMIEGKDIELISKEAEKLAALIEEI